MELTPLRQFIAIATTGHMTRAAESLGVTQPALSAMLKKLEGEVGASLLHRTGKGVELTEAGRVFLEHARAAVRRADEAREAVRQLVGLERGMIRVGGGATAIGHLLPPVVSAVRSQHEGLRFYIREAGSAAVASAVLAGELDLGIVTLPVTGPGSSELMTVARLTDELVLILPPGHRLEGQGEFRWRDLAGEPVVAFEAGSAVRSVLDSAAAGHGVALDVVMELRSIEAIVQMVQARVGVGFVSKFALDGSGEGGVGGGVGSGPRGLRCADGAIERRLGVVRRRDRTPSPGAAAFERALLESRSPAWR